MNCVECGEPIPEPPERYRGNAWYKRCKACGKTYSRARYATRQEKGKDYARRYMARRIAEQRKFLNEYKAGLGCLDCGGLECLEFDHVRGTKCFTIGDGKLWPRGTLLEEVAKCEVRCHDCHTARHGDPDRTRKP